MVPPLVLLPVALLGTWLAIRLLMPWADRLGLIDHPHDARKIHTHPKPLIGGIGMMVGVIVAVLFFYTTLNTIGFLAALSVILVMGVIDDRQGLSFKIRFLIQASAVLFLAYCCNTMLYSFGDLFGLGELQTGWFAVPVTIFCVVGVINAINMLDGLDGLAGGTSLAAFTSFAVLSFLTGHTELLPISLAFIGALIAFLRFNWFPSRLFMGDAGSMTLGFVLAFFAIELTQGDGGTVSPAAALLVLALPITDTITVMLKRIQKGESPFHPDKTHIHHMLMRLGISHRTTVLLIVACSAVSGGLAIAGVMLGLTDAQLLAIFAIGFTAYFVASYRMAALYRLYRVYVKKEQKPDEVELLLEDAA